MANALTLDDFDLILTSLSYTKLKFEEYQKYPSLEYRDSRVGEVAELISKVRELKREMKS